jgi:hypothetical protein
LLLHHLVRLHDLALWGWHLKQTRHDERVHYGTATVHHLPVFRFDTWSRDLVHGRLLLHRSTDRQLVSSSYFDRYQHLQGFSWKNQGMRKKVQKIEGQKIE